MLRREHVAATANPAWLQDDDTKIIGSSSLEKAGMVTDSKALEQIRALLLARRAELQQRRDRVDRDLSRQLEPLSHDADDRAIQLENDESLQAIGQAAVRELVDIDVALDRMTRGLYGICSICGHGISAARLAAVPHASTCQRCGQC